MRAFIPSSPAGLAVDPVNNELFVADLLFEFIAVYARTASGNTAPLRSLPGGSGALFTQLGRPTSLALAPSVPTATVAPNGSAFFTGDTITYQATLTPGANPTRVDIYLGALLPDGVTFLSLVKGFQGAVSIALGRSPVPFSANVTLKDTFTSFSHTFTSTEPVGTYFAYAGLAAAGSNPFQAANQLSLGVQGFQFTP